MARSKAGGTANYMQFAGAVVSGPPCTLACWFIANNTTADHCLISIANSTGTNDINIGALGTQVGDPLYAWSSAGSGGQSAISTTAYTANTWQHGCGVFASSTSRTVYLNGGNSATNTSTASPTGLSNTAVGAYRSNSATSLSLNGTIAEAAIWNAALSAAEVAALARGASPIRIRPGNLAAYWPIYGTGSPERDLVTGTNALTVNGTFGQASHAPVMPACGESIDWIPYAVAAASTIPIARAGNGGGLIVYPGYRKGLAG